LKVRPTDLKKEPCESSFAISAMMHRTTST
jgi:hypothetical protein